MFSFFTLANNCKYWSSVELSMSLFPFMKSPGPTETVDSNHEIRFNGHACTDYVSRIGSVRLCTPVADPGIP